MRNEFMYNFYLYLMFDFLCVYSSSLMMLLVDIIALEKVLLSFPAEQLMNKWLELIPSIRASMWSFKMAGMPSVEQLILA